MGNIHRRNAYSDSNENWMLYTHTYISFFISLVMILIHVHFPRKCFIKVFEIQSSLNERGLLITSCFRNTSEVRTLYFWRHSVHVMCIFRNEGRTWSCQYVTNANVSGFPSIRDCWVDKFPLWLWYADAQLDSESNRTRVHGSC